MLDKTKTAQSGLPRGVPKDREGLVRLHRKLQRDLATIVEAEREAVQTMKLISRYATAHRRELVPQGKSHKLPEGNLGWRDVAPHMSVPKDRRDTVLQILRDEGLYGCITEAPRIVEAALRAQTDTDPALLTKIQKKVPGFTMGQGYEQFWIDFIGSDKRIAGNPDTGEFRVKDKKDD